MRKKNDSTTPEPPIALSAPSGSVGRCDYCNRAGKLVIQDPQTLYGQRWVFRTYLCPWHLGASNKWAKRMGPNFRHLVPIEYKSDEELLSQNAKVRRGDLTRTNNKEQDHE